MAKSKDDVHDPGHRTIIREIRASVVDSRDQVRIERMKYGQVSESAKAQLVRDALRLYDVLYEYRNERAVRDEWDEWNMRWLPQRVGADVEVDEPAAGDTGATKRAEKPAMLTVSIDQLMQYTQNLADIANKLGFAAKAREQLPKDVGTQEDLKALMRTRGQLKGSDEGEAD